MSFQTLLEGDDKKGNLVVKSVNADKLLGMGKIFSAKTAGPVGPLANPVLTVTITDTLVLADVYFVQWSAQVSATLADIEYDLEVEFDLGGQATIIGQSGIRATRANPEGTILSGSDILTIAAGGVGAGKLVTFTGDVGANLRLANCVITLIKLS